MRIKLTTEDIFVLGTMVACAAIYDFLPDLDPLVEVMALVCFIGAAFLWIFYKVSRDSWF